MVLGCLTTATAAYFTGTHLSMFLLCGPVYMSHNSVVLSAIISDSSCYLKKINKPQTYLALEMKH